MKSELHLFSYYGLSNKVSLKLPFPQYFYCAMNYADSSETVFSAVDSFSTIEQPPGVMLLNYFPPKQVRSLSPCVVKRNIIGKRTVTLTSVISTCPPPPHTHTQRMRTSCHPNEKHTLHTCHLPVIYTEVMARSSLSRIISCCHISTHKGTLLIPQLTRMSPKLKIPTTQCGYTTVMPPNPIRHSLMMGEDKG